MRRLQDAKLVMKEELETVELGEFLESETPDEKRKREIREEKSALNSLFTK